MKARTVLFDRNSHAALAKLVAAGARGAEAECSLASLQVRHAHAGKQHAGKLLRRKSHRNANDGAKNARLAQPVPERRPFAQTFYVGFAEWQRILANLQMAFGLADLCGRKIRKIVFQIAGQEIINIVLPRINAGLKRGPCHWRNRRKCGPERTKGAAVAQLGQVGQLAFTHEASRQLGIHAIEPHDHNSFYLRLAVGFAPSKHSQELSYGPGDQRVEGVEKSNKNGPE